jgi:hypothetical protein
MYRRILLTLALAVTATLALSGCVESQMPLMTDAKPLLGQQFEVHLYESFVDGKATDFHTSVYHWQDGQYVRGSGMARDAKRFVAQPLAANDFLIQSSDEDAKVFYYWIGRKLATGVYLIFPLNETDADQATRGAACGTDQPEGICRVRNFDQLVTLARATATKPIREAALGVVLTR